MKLLRITIININKRKYFLPLLIIFNFFKDIVIFIINSNHYQTNQFYESQQ